MPITAKRITLLLLFILPGLASALDMRRWDADVGLVRQQVLEEIATRQPESSDTSSPDQYFKWLLEGLKGVQRELDADAYLIMREAALTIGEEMGSVRNTLCTENRELCREQVDWTLIHNLFSLKLDFVRNILAIID